jgi:hypothetical protein
MGASNYPGLKYAKQRAKALDAEDEVRAAKRLRLCVVCGQPRRNRGVNAVTDEMLAAEV